MRDAITRGLLCSLLAMGMLSQSAPVYALATGEHRVIGTYRNGDLTRFSSLELDKPYSSLNDRSLGTLSRLGELPIGASGPEVAERNGARDAIRLAYDPGNPFVGGRIFSHPEKKEPESSSSDGWIGKAATFALCVGAVIGLIFVYRK